MTSEMEPEETTPEIDQLIGKIQSLSDYLDELQERSDLIKFRLQPYWNERGNLEEEIKQTHGRRADGAIVFNPAGLEVRKPLFEKLMVLTEEWGPERTLSAELKLQIREGENNMRKLKNALKFENRKSKKQKPENDQGTLL